MGKPWTAERVRELRKRRKETQQQLAVALGVNRGTVVAWEKGGEISTLSEAVLEMLELGHSPLEQRGKPASPAEYDSVIATVIATGENRARLGVVQGYAQFVLDQLIELARKQQAVVDGIRPFAEAEGHALAANVPPEKIPELLDSIRRYQAAQAAPDAPAKTRRGTG